MKQAVLYVGHGSRLKQAQKEAAAFLQGCKAHVSAPIQEISFLELQEPSIKTGFEACIKQGATHIAVVPLLLLTAAHAKKDIPEEIARAAARYPAVNITYGKPIGVDDEVVKAVCNRLEETGAPYENARVVLIGRGSSDPAVKKDVTEIAEHLQRMAPVKEVMPCFLTACKPNYRDVFSQLKQGDGTPVFVVPYLLFTGMLMSEIEKEVKKLRDVNPHIYLAAYLGFHPHVKTAFLHRVNETIENQNGQFYFDRGLYAAASH
ncbi:sirohydrochlorin chelatase [Bacillus atrophaeus]|uniref:sirohydrochlorin chelatase n=1 Tax=Bacillus atrophaeus TaxID=1452 RepID=UPI002E247D35|nr:sirohydrochlorin chelatase [Bacillus atrophaeus]MED4819799.1 sirohydrochlorin chelatase [Bacillus atrophaeus]